jgi:hypothetical protein
LVTGHYNPTPFIQAITLSSQRDSSIDSPVSGCEPASPKSGTGDEQVAGVGVPDRTLAIDLIAVPGGK